MLKKIIPILLAVPSFAHAIVPISVEKDISQGLSGSAAISFDYEALDSKKSEMDFDSDIRLNYRYSNQLFKVIYEGSYSENNSGVTDEENFFHFRYIEIEFWNQLNLETFFQFQNNEFEDLSSRTLLGSGLGDVGYKQSLGNMDLTLGYFAGVMYELEKSVRDPSLEASSIRGAFNFNASLENKDYGTRFYFNAYYQPKLDSFNDYRAVAILGFETKAFENTVIGISYDMNYDSDSFNGAYNKKENIGTYLKYNF